MVMVSAVPPLVVTEIAAAASCCEASARLPVGRTAMILLSALSVTTREEVTDEEMESFWNRLKMKIRKGTIVPAPR